MKRIKIILLGLFVVWIVLGYFARIDLKYLIDKYKPVGIDLWLNNCTRYHNSQNVKYRDEYEKDRLTRSKLFIENNIVFGCKFYGEDVYWLNEEQNTKMHNLLINCSFWDFMPFYINEPIRQRLEFGVYFYACPKWVKDLNLQHLLLPLLSTMYMEYYPLKKHLYISQSSEFLSYDYVLGISVTNIPPSLFNLDEKKIKEKIEILEE